MDLVYIGTLEDVTTVREAFDVAMAMPQEPISGPLVVSPERASEMKAAWWQLSTEQRDSELFDHLFPGFSVRWSNLYHEPAPGTRVYTWVTDAIDALIASASAAGRILSIAQVNALLAAKAVATPHLPEDWTPDPEE